MYDPEIALQLGRGRGLDVKGCDAIRGFPDRDVFEFAIHDKRAIVTENVPDFVILANEAIAAGRAHHGLILTSNRSFPRARRSTTGAIVKALALLAKSTPDLTNQMVWLQPSE